MGIGQAMERKGGNCGFTLLPTKLLVHLKLPDFCSLKCRTNCQQVVLLHLDSDLLRCRRQCGASYPFLSYFLTLTEDVFWGILCSIVDLGDMCLKGLFHSLFSAVLSLLLHFLSSFFFPIY